ncbi:MAG: sigma-70 family RNA polymerase sigma factor [Sedimentisphaerales bacterium]|nr:sigma-70 family RNA polymerase sigma factor [Sedimentisphaerales bacterium]
MRSESLQPGTSSLGRDEARLLARCRQGDVAAMETLVLRYQDRLYNAILRICGDPEDAAELTQDTFVKVIEALDRFRGKSSFYTWAFRIAINLALNHCQRRRRIGQRSLDADEDQGRSEASERLRDLLSDPGSADPAVVAQDRELQVLARRALLELDEQQRVMIVLRDIEGMSYAQIAEVLDIELGTVRSRLSRAREALRRVLESMI